MSAFQKRRCGFSRCIGEFLHRSDGVATIEAVLWMPVFVALFAIVADTALLFGSQTNALRVLQDANRAMSVGRFRTVEETEAYILNQVSGMSPNATASTVVVNHVITSRVTIPASDVVATGIVTAFADLEVNVFAEHMAEN